MKQTNRANHYGRTVLSVTTIGILMASMQMSALLISLPDMMGDLHMSMFSVMWVLLVYMLITTAMVPLFGRLADMFGRKRLYVLGFAVFTFGSLLCGLAQPRYDGMDSYCTELSKGSGALFSWRPGLQWSPTPSILRHLGLGLSINGIAFGAGMVIGPVVGGLLAPIGWQWIFFYNVPIGIAGTIWAYIRLRDPSNLPRTMGFDWWGCLVFIVGMTSFLLAVSLYAFPVGLSMDIVYTMFVVGVVGIGAFLWIERKVKTPMLDLQLFKNLDFTIGNVTVMLNGLTRGASLFLLIFFLQGPYGLDPLTAGLSLIPMGLATIVVGPIAGREADRHGPRLLTIAGLAVTAVGMLGLTFIDHNTPFWWLAILMLISGIGGSLFNSPNIKTVMNAAPPERRGIASGTRAMLMNIGSMLSMAIALPMVLSGIPVDDMMKLFLYGGGISSKALVIFENGLHEAFLLFFVISIIAMLISLIKTGTKMRYPL